MHRSSLLFALLFLTLPARAGVLIVDSDGSGNFLDVQSAIDAAADGDAILVRDVQQAAFTIAGKSLTIVGLATGPVDPVIAGNVVVTGVAAGQQVVLSHLQLLGAPGDAGEPGGQALTLADCEGAVHLWRCNVRGGRGGILLGDPTPQPGGTAIGVNACSDVALSTCTVVGGYGGYNEAQGGAGGAALEIVAGSNVALMASSATGGVGGGAYPDAPDAGGSGGSAVVLSQSTLFDGGYASNALYGGAGGPGLSLWGDGGNGVELDATSLARVRGPVPSGGPSQVAPGSEAQAGAPGVPVVTLGGSLLTLAGTLPYFSGVNAVSLPGEAVILNVSTLGGGSGPKLLLASLQGTTAYVGSQSSPLLVAPPWIAAGVSLPNGVLTLQAPHLPSGIDVVPVHLQAWDSGVGLTNEQLLVLLEHSPWN